MSLINQMLQDLEKRAPEAESEALPHGVISAHAEKRRKVPFALLGGLLLAVAGATWFLTRNQPVVPVPAAAESVAAPADSKTEAPIVLAPARSVSQPRAEATARPVVQEKKPALKEEKKRSEPLVAAKPAAKASPLSGKIDKSPAQGEASEMAEALYRQAASAFHQGRSGESIEKLRQALGFDSSHAAARQLLAKQLLEQRSLDEARAVLRDGARQHPAQLQWASLLARLELERGDANAARQALDLSLAYAGGNADFQSLAGAVAQRQGKPGEAADFYRLALRLKPADGRSWVGLGLALEAEGHGPEAKEAFRRALDGEGLSPELVGLAQRKLR